MLYSYSFQNKKRDLSDVLSTVIKDEPRFISLFGPAENATQQKHEWLEDQLIGRSVTVTTLSGTTFSASAADLAKLRVGTLVVVKDDSALFQVATLTDSGFTLTLVAANGSDTELPAANDVLSIVSTPVREGSSSGEGDETGLTGQTAYNCTQIFRKDIILSGSALAVNVFGTVDNQLNKQTAFALSELARDLNRVALFGRRVEATATTRGEAGGLYFFGCGGNGLAIDASAAAFDSVAVNDAAQAVLGAGGDPSLILCSPGQARVLSNEYKNQLQIVRSDDRPVRTSQ